MEKICYNCKVPKSLDEFHKRRNGQAQSTCMICHREYVRKHYQLNTQKYKDKAVRNRKKYADNYKDYKENLFCTDCGMSFKDKSYLCDFHHTDDSKDITPSLLYDSKKKFLKEIEKCIPLCANCHRTRHYS